MLLERYGCFGGAERCSSTGAFLFFFCFWGTGAFLCDFFFKISFLGFVRGLYINDGFRAFFGQF